VFMTSKQPEYDEATGSYVLDFQGRVNDTRCVEDEMQGCINAMRSIRHTPYDIRSSPERDFLHRTSPMRSIRHTTYAMRCPSYGVYAATLTGCSLAHEHGTHGTHAVRAGVSF
jgi:hypothetical protein